MKLRAVYFILAVVVLFVAVALGQVNDSFLERVILLSPKYHVAEGGFSTVPVSAEAYLVFDAASGEVLGGKGEQTPHEMASIVKLLTADTALSIADIEASTTISWRAVATEGRSGKLQYGEEYRLRELLFPLLLESSNDAAEAIAEGYGRESFISEMNRRRDELGMASTTVVDPSGLSRGNTTTAQDLRTFVTHLYTAHRHILDITSLTTFIGSNHTWRNTDPLITSEGFIGGKQGYTDSAGRTLAAVFDTRFEEDRVRPIGIILLSSDDLVGDVSLLRDEVTRTVSYDVEAL